MQAIKDGMKCQQNDKLITSSNIYLGFYCYILDLFFDPVYYQKCNSLICVLFYHRDLKPENILLDDRGKSMFVNV